MELSVERHLDVVVVRLAGRIDHLNADAFRTALLPYLEACKAGGDRLLFDLSALDYISSSGLQVLMLAAKQVKPVGGEIAVAGLQPVIREIFEISRFERVFPIHTSISEGLAALSPAERER